MYVLYLLKFFKGNYMNINCFFLGKLLFGVVLFRLVELEFGIIKLDGIDIFILGL